MRSFGGLEEGNIEEEGTSILMRSIENSEVRMTIFIFVGRSEDMKVFRNCSREGMISTSHCTVTRPDDIALFPILSSYIDTQLHSYTSIKFDGFSKSVSRQMVLVIYSRLPQTKTGRVYPEI